MQPVEEPDSGASDPRVRSLPAVTDACVLRLAGSKSPRGAGWGVVLRSPAGQVLARASGGEVGATSERMELVALLRGLASLPSGTRRLEVRLANSRLASICEAFVRDGVLPRKARHQDLLRDVRASLSSLEARWSVLSRAGRDAWDKEVKVLAQESAVQGEALAAEPASRRGEASEPPCAPPAPAAAPAVVAPSAAGVVVFTDGGCRGNPGPGGWGFLIVDAATHAAMERRGGEPHTTNNRMELTAAIRALEALRRPRERVEVRSDSQYLVNMCSRWLRAWKARGWRRKDKGEVLNLDLVRRLDELIARHEVRWTWVRGHAGDRGNEHVDRLASRAIDLVAQGADAGAEVRYGPGQSPIRLAGATSPRGAASA